MESFGDVESRELRWTDISGAIFHLVIWLVSFSFAFNFCQFLRPQTRTTNTFTACVDVVSVGSRVELCVGVREGVNVREVRVIFYFGVK